MNNQWYLRTQDETFGPESKARLLEWARMGRIQPGQEISSDGETWTPATEVPFLDMRWSIDIGDGRPRGPFNKMAAQALLSSGRLPPGSRIVEVRPPFETPNPPSGGTNSSSVPGGTRSRASETPKPETAAPPAPPDESPALRREIERLKEALKEAESRVRAARREAKDAAEAARSAEARMSAVMAQSATIESEKAKALKDLDELAAAKAARESEIAEERAEAQKALAASKANETKNEARIQELSDELKRLPATARLAADAQAAVYALMKDEADDIAAGIEEETRELDELRTIHQARRERLIARRQEILKRIGTDAEDMTRRALLAHPEDPRTAHMRQELEALRLLQEKAATESDRKVRDLSAKLRERDAEVKRLQQQAADTTVLYRQLQEMRERLQRREKELMEERQKAEAERQQHAAAQQSLMARLSALEMGLPGATNQSREARSVRLAPWMGLKK